MSRQLNLRVSDEFADRLERLSRGAGRPMAAVLEEVGTPALAMAEADRQFESEALAAWETYQLDGIHATSEEIEVIFRTASARAKAVAAQRLK